MIRYAIVSHMRKMSACVSKYCSLKNIEDYIFSSKMSANRVWATDVEIITVASLFKVDIVVFTDYGDKGEKWLNYPSSFLLESLFSAPILLRNKNFNFEPLIDLE